MTPLWCLTNQMVGIWGKVTNTRTQTSEFYTGVTARRYKDRLYEHQTSFNKRNKKTTTLSDHIWKLKDQNDPYTVSGGSKTGVETLTLQPSCWIFVIKRNSTLRSIPKLQL